MILVIFSRYSRVFKIDFRSTLAGSILQLGNIRFVACIVSRAAAAATANVAVTNSTSSDCTAATRRGECYTPCVWEVSVYSHSII